MTANPERRVMALKHKIREVTKYQQARGGGPLLGLTRSVDLLLDELIDAMQERDRTYGRAS